MSEKVIDNTCHVEKYGQHNFHNEKVNKWLIENHAGGAWSTHWGCKEGDGFGCGCEEENEEYDHYYDKYDYEELIAGIPDLTEEEKEELESVENIRVYLCPECGTWSVDGDNC